MTMEIQELCRKLKPIIGNQADRYWMAYLAEDYRGRQELEIAFRLLAAKLLGADIENPEVHLSMPPAATAQGAYPMGHVVYANKQFHTFGLREDELIQHTAIFGRSGAGKTNTVVQFIGNLLEHGKPFLIFDWKRNYRDLLAVREEPIFVYTVGRSAAPLSFNPLIPPDGTDAAVWLKKVIEIVAHSYYLGEGVMFLLQEAIHAVYQEFGMYNGRPQTYPTFREVLQWLEHHPAKGRKALWMDSAMRGIKSICFGHMGNVVNIGTRASLGNLLKKNVVLELDGLSNADKTLITESMLLWIHHYRLTQPDRETFKHAIIIEEAHHILRKQAGGGAEPLTETILREIRELGEGITLVDQHPSMISIPALGNTYTTITMNLKHRSDVNAIAAAMLMDDDEREILGRLPIGAAVVKLQGRWLRPFRVRIPLCALPKGSVGDCELIQRMIALGGIVPNPAPSGTGDHTLEGQPEQQPLEHEAGLLRDVAEHPFSGVVERYKRLGASRRKGNMWKEACLAKGWIGPVDVATRSGRVVLLELTPEGQGCLRGMGVEVPDGSRWGGLEHEYWKDRIAHHLESLGFTVKVEEPVNGFTDVVAELGGVAMAVEVETGRSDWKGNLAKNRKKGFPHIIIAATNEEALKRMQAFIEAESSDARVVQAWEVVETRDADELLP